MVREFKDQIPVYRGDKILLATWQKSLTTEQQKGVEKLYPGHGSQGALTGF